MCKATLVCGEKMRLKMVRKGKNENWILFERKFFQKRHLTCSGTFYSSQQCHCQHSTKKFELFYMAALLNKACRPKLTKKPEVSMTSSFWGVRSQDRQTDGRTKWPENHTFSNFLKKCAENKLKCPIWPESE